MAVTELCKNDIAAVFKRLRGIPSNKMCFDCGAKNPTWASVTYGVFICMDCSAVHRSLGVHLSFVRSTQLDTNWTWLQLRAMQVGGNSNALSFFQQHGCTSTDAQQKYNSRAAQLYREKLHHQAAAAMRLHGTKLHIDSPHADHPQSPEKREVDFFKEHADSSLHLKDSENDMLNGSLLTTSPNLSVTQTPNESDLGANLEAALSVSPTEAQKHLDARKSTIGSRKPAAAKKGLGVKKGLGAQRVHTNFTEIEKEAQKVDQQRELIDSTAKQQNFSISNADEEKQSASVRLAYKDLSLIQKQTEDRMRHMDPKKAEQLERLGMGLISGCNTSGGFAHSAASDMKLITQETPSQASRNRDLDLEDDFEFLSFTSGPPKYGDSPFLSRSSSDRLSDFSSKGSWTQEKLDKKSTSEMIPSQKDPISGRSRKAVSAGSTPVSSDEAQRKFGNAKAISSEQFFGPDRDSEFERRTNLSRFEGSNCISSEDFFSNGSSQRNPSPTYSGPNLYDIKEGVKDGVTKVAGRLSSLANGVMSSLQEKYGY